MPLLFAHLMETGFGGFYDGIAHLLITPADVLLVLGLALLAGQQGAAGGRLLLALLPVSWWLGGSVGQLWGLDHTLSLITTSLVTSFGLLFGVVNGFTMPAVRQGVSLDMLGVVTAVAVLSVLISGQVVVMRSPAVKIAVRVMGSWIAAAGLLSLGLWLKG
jgi:urease accessory protein